MPREVMLKDLSCLHDLSPGQIQKIRDRVSRANIATWVTNTSGEAENLTQLFEFSGVFFFVCLF